MMRNRRFLITCLCAAIFFAGCKEDAPANDGDAKEEVKTGDVKQVSSKTPKEHKEATEKKENKTNISRKESGDRDIEVSGGRKDKLLALVNNARAKGCRCGGKYYKPVQPLTWNNKLERAAQKHSRYMRRRNVLSHAGQGGSDAGRRISAEGYDWISYGENVAAGYGSDEATIKGWLKSKGHCKNIMSPKFKEMGMASSGQFYTQVFGTRR
jgi:uncharacterized protein YkwD